MSTLPRLAHSVNDRRSQQCARPGWRPQRGSDQQLAADIAASIREHRADGDTQWTKPDEFTADESVLALVHELLAVEAQTPAACPPTEATCAKDQYPTSSPEWTALTKLDVADYETALAHEMAAYHPACLQAQEGTQ